MQLDWVVDYSQNKLTLELDNIVYQTFDGGQNIDKYIDGEFDKRIRQYPYKPYDWVQPHMEKPPSAEFDEWCRELDWIIETFPHVGERHPVLTYKEQDGSITNTQNPRGQGANNLTDLISVNRLGQPASVQERWDWDFIATTDCFEHISNTMHDKDPHINKAQAGLSWVRNKRTGVIERIGSSQNCPCHVFPEIYPPVEIHPDDLYEDVTNYGGHFIEP